MIHELRTYTARAGAVPEILKVNEEVGRKARGNDYGVLEGYWYTEIGPLNQVMHLWRFDSYEERTRLRAELSKVDDWTNKYVPTLRPLLVNQTTRFLNPAKELVAPAKEGNFYEFRNYRLKPGKAAGWMKRFIDVMPTREKYSQNVCAWITEGPNPNEVCHLGPIRASRSAWRRATASPRRTPGRNLPPPDARNSRRCTPRCCSRRTSRPSDSRDQSSGGRISWIQT